ncbi:uncharacterized protein LOC134209116 [Armigeres subalbatus]|uniref:uncharacterized protein LOC134209116 n=1 Tax=Armigeres subalbatus TaxID=124917 RepID=UPI002ED48D09
MFPIPESQEFLPEILEVKPTTLAAVARSVKVPDHTLFCRYSSLTRLIRIAAYCRRFVRHCRSKIAGAGLQVTPFLTADELQQALIGIVKVVQEDCFSHEIAIVQAGAEADLRKSPLKTLYPFMHDGLLRVGGRLNHSSFSFTRKHPILLPEVHPLTSLLIDSVHKQLLHAGPRAMIAHIREQFWPLHLRNLARRHVNSCLRCYRVRPQSENQLMGQLPKVRVTPARAFLNTGVDFCGPVWLKSPVRRAAPV